MKKTFILLAATMWVSAISFAQTGVNVSFAGHLPYTTDLNDVWGYADTVAGQEYALVGVRNGFSVVNVTNPTTPVEEFFIPGTATTWRDIKTWDHYAYVMHDAGFPGMGLLIVDLDSIDNPHYKFMYPHLGSIGIQDSVLRSHNLWIDEQGYLYIFGGDVANGGAVIVDVATDPWNPVVVGLYDQVYLHDGYVRGDTLWGAGLANGIRVVNTSVKNNPLLMQTFSTPSNFAHNCWLSDNSDYLFTTDEVSAAYLTAYDVRNLANVQETDRIRLNPNDGTIPHNVHVLGNLMFTSYYTYGLHITDISVPDWLIEVGSYDTSPLSGNGFDGAWGAYPFLPSGIVLISDINEGLFILEPDYTEAARIVAVVTDSISGLPLGNAQVLRISDLSPYTPDTATGAFRMESVGPYTDSLNVTHPGYFSRKFTYTLQEGSLDTLHLRLLPEDFSLAEENMVSMRVYPNPSDGEFAIETSEPMQDAMLTIFDLSGRELYRDQHTNQKTSIKVDLPSGVYLLEIHSETQRARKRLVIE